MPKSDAAQTWHESYLYDTRINLSTTHFFHFFHVPVDFQTFLVLLHALFRHSRKFLGHIFLVPLPIFVRLNAL